MLRRFPLREDPEWQARVRRVREAGRRGESPADIAVIFGLPPASVQKILAPGVHPRLSDPGDLLRTGQVGAGQVSADVQLYWFGFFTAAGYIRGHGASFTLIVTLGEDGRGSLDALEADLMMGPIRCEFCHSSLAGWQGYFRDPTLCHALIRWGIPSDLYGEDPALLEDFPEELFVPFMRGYMEGSELAHPPARQHTNRLAIHGTTAVLAGLNALIKRHWGISSGAITQVGASAELRFSDPVARDAIAGRLDTISSRL